MNQKWHIVYCSMMRVEGKGLAILRWGLKKPSASIEKPNAARITSTLSRLILSYYAGFNFSTHYQRGALIFTCPGFNIRVTSRDYLKVNLHIKLRRIIGNYFNGAAPGTHCDGSFC